MTTAWRPHTAPVDHRPPEHPGRLRIALAVTAVAACVPYLVLKIIWLSGGNVGLNDSAVADSSVMELANLLTFGMELVGATLAVLLVLPIGRRVPATVVQVPMYVGTGLLGGILLLTPIRALMNRGQTETAPDPAHVDPIQPWVYSLVYAGFVVLGLALLAIFADHAWTRWVVPGGWTARLAAFAPTSQRTRTIVTAHGLFMVAVCTTGAVIAARADLLGAHDLMAVLMSLACLAGLLALAYRNPGRARAAVPLVMAYVGSAAVAAWGAFFTVMLAVPNPLVGDEEVPAGLLVVAVLRTVNGVLTLLALPRLGPGIK